MDALDIPRAILAGYDWGGRAACVAAALWPERCAGLVSVNSYLIQDTSTATTPLRPELEAGFWYFFYFATEPGRLGLTANRRGIARLIWTRNSPNWHFDDAMLDRAARAFDNPDYVDIVIHSYGIRSRGPNRRQTTASSGASERTRRTEARRSTRPGRNKRARRPCSTE